MTRAVVFGARVVRAAMLIAAAALVAAPAAAQPGPPDAGVPEADAATARPAPPPEPELPAAHRPSLDVRLTSARIKTGDLTTLRIVATLTRGDDISLPVQPFGKLERHATRRRVEEAEGGKQRVIMELDLLALEPGDHEIPSLELRVVTSENDLGSVRTRPLRVRVDALSGNEPNAQPKPPTKPVRVMQDDYTLAWIAGAFGALLLTVLVTVLVGRWWRKRKRPAPPPPPPRPAWDVALEKLESLRRDKAHLIADGRANELVDRVSDAMREYWGARYGFEGLESTTDEVLGRLTQITLGGGITVHEVAALLGDCDLVKFAKAEPDEATCEQLIQGALRMVHATTPRGPNGGPR